MSDVTYQVDAGNLPAGSCPSTYQELADLLATIYSVTVSTNNTGIYVSVTQPADTTLVWKRLDASSLRPLRDYVFVGGLWLSRHTLEPNTIIMYDATIADINTFDGGAAGAVTPISGPMWEYVTELQAKMPIGAGTLPSGTILAIGDTGGEETHTLTTAELASHTHGISASTAVLDINATSSRILYGENDVITNLFTQTALTQAAGSGSAHNNLPPYYTVSFLRRTIREYYTV